MLVSTLRLSWLNKVTVRTRAAGEKPENGVFWESAGEGEYTVADITKEDRGTEITLHLREGEDEFLDDWRVRSIISTSHQPILRKKARPSSYSQVAVLASVRASRF